MTYIKKKFLANFIMSRKQTPLIYFDELNFEIFGL